MTIPATPREEKLADFIGKLSLYFCTEEFTDNRSSSAIVVYFSGILGFSPSGTTFERPKNYTSKISALVYCIRLCLLEATLPRFAHSSIGWKARPSSGNLKRLNRVRERFMCLSCQAPLGELLSLRSYGRAISRSDGPSFRVQWSDDSEKVKWDGGTLSMNRFRQLGHHAVQSATTLITRLMYGVRLTIRLDSIRDSISNVARGYSFVQDPVNGLAKAYLDLSASACLDPLDGLMKSERWNHSAVHRYLKEEADLLTQLMLVMYLRGGQAPRTTEFFSIECCNGPSTSRGIYVHAGAIVYVTRHAKARRLTNQEFQVARYLPPHESELLVQYLIYIRPFAEMLRRECYGYRTDRRLLFSSSEDPERPWNSTLLTKALKKLSVDVGAVPFGVQIYRQLSIAVTEKHIKQISRPFNRYDDRSANADIEVAFAWQSGHRPLQRGTTYGIDSAYPDSLQPALLRLYHWASKEWQSFLQIPNHASGTDAISGPFRANPSCRDRSLDSTITRNDNGNAEDAVTRSYQLSSRRGSPSQFSAPTSTSQDSSFEALESTFKFSDSSFPKKNRQARSNVVDLGFDSQSNDMPCASPSAQLSRDNNAAKRTFSHRDSLSEPQPQKVRKLGSLASAVAAFGKQRRNSRHTNRDKTLMEQILYHDDDDEDNVDTVSDRTEAIPDILDRSNSEHSDWSRGALFDFEKTKITRSKACEKSAEKQVASGNPRSNRSDYDSPELDKADSDKDCDSINSVVRQAESTQTSSNFRWPEQKNRLQECLVWWEQKCAYCVGKGWRDTRIEHKLRSCPNGGRQQCFKGVGEAVYLEGFLVQAGCHRCAVPKKLCAVWKQSNNQQWKRKKKQACQWGTVIYDTVIALFHSGMEQFYLDLYETILDESDADYAGLDHESIAAWLTRPKDREEQAESAEITRVFEEWTRIVRDDWNISASR